MAKRNWDVIVVVPGRMNNDGTETKATYFAGKREDSEHGRKLVGMKEITPVTFAPRKRTSGK
jgi:hypothetical protein